MRSKKLWFAAIASISVLLSPLPLAAQANNSSKQPHYVVKDMSTFGGPNSYFFSEPVVESVNNQGIVTGGADTGLSDPYAPNCFVTDCHIVRAFK
jgi:hypothetical protein